MLSICMLRTIQTKRLCAPANRIACSVHRSLLVRFCRKVRWFSVALEKCRALWAFSWENSSRCQIDENRLFSSILNLFAHRMPMRIHLLNEWRCDILSSILSIWRYVMRSIFEYSKYGCHSRCTQCTHQIQMNESSRPKTNFESCVDRQMDCFRSGGKKGKLTNHIIHNVIHLKNQILALDTQTHTHTSTKTKTKWKTVKPADKTHAVRVWYRERGGK